MKENGELTREDIMIESDMEVADDNENQILVYVETWFDVDQKFGLHPGGILPEGEWYGNTVKIFPVCTG